MYASFSVPHTCLYFPHADGLDYSGGIFTVILQQGQNRVCLNIPIIDDDLSEPTFIETFLIFLFNLDPGVDNSASTSTVQIIDDDGKFS